MATINRDKGVFTIHVEGKAKPYIFDINKGQLIGLTGKVLVTIPTTLRDALHSNNIAYNTLRMLNAGYNIKNVELYTFADRLDSLGITYVNPYDLRWLYDHSANYSMKELVAYFKEYGENGSADDFERKILHSNWCKKVGLKVDEHFTESMSNWLYNNRSWFDNDPHTQRVVAYWLARGLWDYYGGEYYNMGSKLRELYRKTKELGWRFEKEDYFRQAVNIIRTHKARENEILNSQIKAYQDSHIKALTFETDTHIIIVPTTNDELIREGERQNNCVGGYGSSIARGRTNVVFVRLKADPTKNYITCNITASGEIQQYLKAYNVRVFDESDLAFKALYQEHLRECWGE